MKTYFKILDEYVKAWQFNGEFFDEFPLWVRNLSGESKGWAYMIDGFGGDVYVANHMLKRGDWIVSSVEGVAVMDDDSFRAVYDNEDNA